MEFNFSLILVLGILALHGHVYMSPCLHYQNMHDPQSNSDHYPECFQCKDSRLDPSTNCTNCKEGEPHCHTGSFYLSVVFHSYLNKKHLCGECREEDFGPVCCDTYNETENCPENCSIRITLSLEAYSSSPADINLQPRPPDFRMDNISQFEEGPDTFKSSMISNPYEVPLEVWTERFQLYIVIHVFYDVEENNDTLNLRRHVAVDRFFININLGAPPAILSRRTYTGIFNISQLDLSFKIECNENSSYANCDPGQYNCSNVGEKTCQNKPCNNSATCESGDNSDCINCSPPETNNETVGIIAGAVGGSLVAAVLLVILIIYLVWRSRQKSKSSITNTSKSKSQDAETTDNKASSCKEDLYKCISLTGDLQSDLHDDEQKDDPGHIHCQPSFTGPKEQEERYINIEVTGSKEQDGRYVNIGDNVKFHTP